MLAKGGPKYAYIIGDFVEHVILWLLVNIPMFIFHIYGLNYKNISGKWDAKRLNGTRQNAPILSKIVKDLTPTLKVGTPIMDQAELYRDPGHVMYKVNAQNKQFNVTTQWLYLIHQFCSWKIFLDWFFTGDLCECFDSAVNVKQSKRLSVFWRWFSGWFSGWSYPLVRKTLNIPSVNTWFFVKAY